MTSETMAMAGNRKYPRKPVILKVDYRDVNKFFTHFAENLSVGGMFIATSRPLPPGTSIFLEFMLPDSNLKIRTRGEVVWARSSARSKKKRGMGIKFMDLSKEDKLKIDKMIARLKNV